MPKIKNIEFPVEKVTFYKGVLPSTFNHPGEILETIAEKLGVVVEFEDGTKEEVHSLEPYTVHNILYGTATYNEEEEIWERGSKTYYSDTNLPLNATYFYEIVTRYSEIKANYSVLVEVKDKADLPVIVSQNDDGEEISRQITLNDFVNKCEYTYAAVKLKANVNYSITTNNPYNVYYTIKNSSGSLVSDSNYAIANRLAIRSFSVPSDGTYYVIAYSTKEDTTFQISSVQATSLKENDVVTIDGKQATYKGTLKVGNQVEVTENSLYEVDGLSTSMGYCVEGVNSSGYLQKTYSLFYMGTFSKNNDNTIQFVKDKAQSYIYPAGGEKYYVLLIPSQYGYNTMSVKGYKKAKSITPNFDISIYQGIRMDVNESLSSTLIRLSRQKGLTVKFADGTSTTCYSDSDYGLFVSTLKNAAGESLSAYSMDYEPGKYVLKMSGTNVSYSVNVEVKSRDTVPKVDFQEIDGKRVSESVSLADYKNKEEYTYFAADLEVGKYYRIYYTTDNYIKDYSYYTLIDQNGNFVTDQSGSIKKRGIDAAFSVPSDGTYYFVFYDYFYTDIKLYISEENVVAINSVTLSDYDYQKTVYKKGAISTKTAIHPTFEIEYSDGNTVFMTYQDTGKLQFVKTVSEDKETEVSTDVDQLSTGDYYNCYSILGYDGYAYAPFTVKELSEAEGELKEGQDISIKGYATPGSAKSAKTEVYKVTLEGGSVWKISCANSGLTLKDAEGNVYVKNNGVYSEGVIVYEPEKTETFYLVVYYLNAEETTLSLTKTKKITDARILTQPVYTEYLYGHGYPTADGLSVEITYADGTKEIVYSKNADEKISIITPNDITEVGEHKFEVKVLGFKTRLYSNAIKVKKLVATDILVDQEIKVGKTAVLKEFTDYDNAGALVSKTVNADLGSLYRIQLTKGKNYLITADYYGSIAICDDSISEIVSNYGGFSTPNQLRTFSFVPDATGVYYLRVSANEPVTISVTEKIGIVSARLVVQPLGSTEECAIGVEPIEPHNACIEITYANGEVEEITYGDENFGQIVKQIKYYRDGEYCENPIGGGKYCCEFILDGAEGDIVLRTDYFSQLRYVWDYAYPVNVGEEKGEFAEYKGTYYLRLTTQAGKKYIVSGKNTGTNFSLYRLKAGVCTLIKNANEDLVKENCIIDFEAEESVAYVIRFDSKNANNPRVSLTEAKNIEKIEFSDDNPGLYQYYYGNACKPDNLELDIYYEGNSIARKVNYLTGSWYLEDETRYYPGFFIEVVKSDKVTPATKDSRGYYPANNAGECYYWKITPNENHTDTEACTEYVPFVVISVFGKYTITYNSSAEALSEEDPLATVSGKMSKQSVKANTATALWGNKFICKGYTFVGWTDSETIPCVFSAGFSLEDIEDLYGEKIYKSGEKVINLSGNGSITLYAVWKQEKYTITYHLGGASFVSGARPVYSYTHTSEEIDLQPISNMLDTISVSPYTFNGWYLNADCKKKVTEIPAGSTGNIDLYALWSPPTYTIMFYGNGGTAKYEKYSQNITFGVATTLIANPYSNTGLGFAGWATESSEGLMVCSDKERIEINNDNLTDFDVNGDGLIELHATWADSFQIYYDLDGDGTTGDNLDEILATGLITLKEGTYPSSYQYGSVVKLDPKPVRKGFTFGGWYEDRNYKKKASSITAKDCGNKTFYAKWLANEYTIAFNANGGSGKVASVRTKYFDDLSRAENKIIVSLPECNFKKLGYYFYAWYTTVNGEKQYYSPGTEVYNMASQKGKTVNFYPEWRPETYKVYFSTEGGILDDENVKTDIAGISYMEFTYNKNVSTITLPTPKLEDFAFAGWFTDRTYKKQVKNVKGLSASVTLYAKWNRNYTIHFDANGGSGTMADIKANTAKAVSLTGKFKKNGYAFSGWSLEPQNDNSTDIQFANKQSLINPEKSMLKKEGEGYSLTLYAVWRNTFGLQFDSLCDDAYFYDSVDGQKLSEYTYAKEVKVLPKPIRSGYTFTGWYLDRQLKKKVTKIAKTDCGDLTLYAGWKAKSYQITFVANAPEGVKISGKTEKQTLNYNIAKKLNKCKFSAKGYTFLGWATTPNGKVKYQNLEKVTSIGGKYKEKVTLYAVWEKNTYLVRYETAYDGMNTITYEIGDAVAIKDIPEPARLGYTFAGWYTDSSLKKKFTGVKAGDTGNYTLHAKWKRNK